MKRRPLLVLILAATATIAVAAWFGTSQSRPPPMDLSEPPRTVFATNPFTVDDTYTLGSVAVRPEVPRPVRITDVVVLHASGIEVVGIGAFEPATERVGLVPGWPPAGPSIKDPRANEMTWSGAVDVLVGVRVVAPKSGFRGIEVRWVDGEGAPGREVFDLAVVTCAPGACVVEAEDADPLLRELGLLKPP